MLHKTGTSYISTDTILVAELAARPGVRQSAVMTSSPSNHPLSAALGVLGDVVSLNSIHILFC